jgi:hypothetical protein
MTNKTSPMRLSRSGSARTPIAAVNKSPFESARSIAETLRVAHSTAVLHLHDSIGFRSFHLHREPHLLMHDSNEKRMRYAQAMLPVLFAAERIGWHYLVTSDEL